METLSFKIGRKEYVSAILHRWLMRNIWIFVGVFVALIILGSTVNAAFLIVALMFVFILTPTALMFVYYQYALKPKIVMLTVGDTTVAVSHDRLIVNITREEGVPYCFEIPLVEVTSITPEEPNDIVIYGNEPDKILLIDRNSFRNETERVNFHNFIFDRIKQ